MHSGYWWIAGRSPRLGTVSYGPTMSLLFWGILIIIAGVIPWPKQRPLQTPPPLTKNFQPWTTPSGRLRGRFCSGERREL